MKFLITGCVKEIRILFFLNPCGGGALSGCKYQRPVLVSATIPFQVYTKSKLANEIQEINGDETGFSFPNLEIFSNKGKLIYSGDDAFLNTDLLNDLADDKNIKKGYQTSTPLLQLATIEVPEFYKNRKAILGSNMICILSVTYDGCDACSLQGSTLNKVKDVLLKRHMNMLILHISH